MKMKNEAGAAASAAASRDTIVKTLVKTGPAEAAPAAPEAAASVSERKTTLGSIKFELFRRSLCLKLQNLHYVW